MAYDRNRFKKEQIPTLREFLSASGIEFRDGKGSNQLLQINIPRAGWQALCINNAGVVTSPPALRQTNSEFQRWLKMESTVPADHAPYKGEKAFKNFHRNLCERFGAIHDPLYWWRDQCSLEEHIAGLIAKPEAEPAPTNNFLEDLRDDFAMHAMQAWIGSADFFDCGDSNTLKSTAEFSYRMADAMLEARKVKP